MIYQLKNEINSVNSTNTKLKTKIGTVYKLNNLLEICKNFLEENIKKLVLQLK